MKRCMLVASLALAALAGVGLAGSAVAGEFVPFKGVLEGIDQALTPPPSVVIHGIGGGQATQLGQFTYDFQAIVEFVPPPPTGHGILVLTAANGDTLTADVNGTSKPIIPGLLVLVTEHAVILEGTGRFAGAIGEIRLERLVYQDSRVTIGSMEGFVSTPGAKGD
jgi:hypothetical protein